MEDADEDGNEPGFISEEERARSLMVDMPNPHGSIIEGANGGEGTIVRAAFLGKEMQTSFLEYSCLLYTSDVYKRQRQLCSASLFPCFPAL